jgi:putative ATP-dependent endonuclease of the OLD family
MPTLTKLIVRGYRSVKGPLTLRVPPGLPLVLLGENNAGKSNLVRAFSMVLGHSYTGNHDPEDHEFFGRDRREEIEIVARFAPTDPLDGGYTEAIWSYGVEKENEASLLVGPSSYPGKRYDFMRNDTKSSCVCFVVEADRSLGWHLSYTSKFTFLSRLMHEFHKALTEEPDVKAELEDLFAQIKRRFDSVQRFATFSDTLKDQLSGFAGPMTHRLEVDFQAYNPVNFFHALRLHATDGEQPRSLEELGTGEHQILALSFAYAFATTFHRGMVLIIEEPEAHLHPLAQQWLASRVRQMCEGGLQIVLTTHSPHFISILGLEGIALVRKGASGTTVAQLNRAELVGHCVASGVPSARITPENVLPFYTAVATPQILEGFFAKVVVLVEGPSEALALPAYLTRCKVVPSRDGVAVIPVGGKGNLGKWHRLFTAYGIPTYVVFDNDGRRDDPSGDKRRDALRAVGVPEEECTTVVEGNEWHVRERFMVFGQNFEEALREAIPEYSQAEAEARAQGVEAKPFVARWVAERIRPGESPGRTNLREFAEAIRALLPVQPSALGAGSDGLSSPPTTGRVSRPAPSTQD